nr:ParB N-terminal domain-containing protein [Nocardioides convexus]
MIPHPRNPRHNAIADDESMGSIKEQGLLHDLLVAPHPDQPGKAYLVDGHRRYDALTRLGFSLAPVKWRLDLVDEGDQVAAMLGTTRREDLTPLEEAEGFDLLTELGWTAEQISDKTGRSTSTVNARRKATRLKDRAKARRRRRRPHDRRRPAGRQPARRRAVPPRRLRRRPRLPPRARPHRGAAAADQGGRRRG